CHDPHQLPAAAEKAAYYRGRCLECHAEKGCSLPAAERRRQQADDSCAACHMRARSTDLAHSTITDHRVLRTPEAAPRVAGVLARRLVPEVRLVPFHQELAETPDEGILRDLALALLRDAPSDPEGRPTAGLVLQLLQTAVKARPRDASAWRGRGEAL